MSPDYLVLHDDYPDWVRDMGEVLLMHALDPKELETVSDWARYADVSDMILKEGGCLEFDRQESPEGVYSRNIFRYVPEDCTVQISGRAFEGRLLGYDTPTGDHVKGHIDGLIRTIGEALQLRDIDPKFHPQVGLMHEELRDLAAFVQAYQIGKEKGIDELRKVAPALQQGQLLQY